MKQPEGGLTNSLCSIYSTFTGGDVQSTERRKALNDDMSAQEVFVQQFARLFHHYREALSPEAEQESATWNSVPPDERHRLVAAARLAILELDSNALVEDDSRRYFAKPGEAEWGC